MEFVGSGWMDGRMLCVDLGQGGGGGGGGGWVNWSDLWTVKTERESLRGALNLRGEGSLLWAKYSSRDRQYKYRGLGCVSEIKSV